MTMVLREGVPWCKDATRPYFWGLYKFICPQKCEECDMCDFTGGAVIIRAHGIRRIDNDSWVWA